MAKEEKEESVVKVDSEVYEIARSRVLDNPVEFPSIKNFIEKAIVANKISGTLSKKCKELILESTKRCSEINKKFHTMSHLLKDVLKKQV